MKDIELYHHIYITRKVIIFIQKNKKLNIKGLGAQSTTFLSNCSLSLIKSCTEKVSGNFQTFIINTGTVDHKVKASNYSDTGSGMLQQSTV